MFNRQLVRRSASSCILGYFVAIAASFSTALPIVGVTHFEDVWLILAAFMTFIIPAIIAYSFTCTWSRHPKIKHLLFWSLAGIVDGFVLFVGAYDYAQPSSEGAFLILFPAAACFSTGACAAYIVTATLCARSIQNQNAGFDVVLKKDGNDSETN
jgi:hypothetical protein